MRRFLLLLLYKKFKNQKKNLKILSFIQIKKKVLYK